MIEATQRRLRAAQFFYRRLVDEQKHPALNEPEVFRHFFGAFINAARSIPWVMQNEEKEKYDAWLPVWEEQLTPEERKLLKVTNELRLDEVKRQGADIIVEFEEVAIHELISPNFDLERLHPAYGTHIFSALPGTPQPKTHRPAYYLEHEDGKAQVTTVCKRYLDDLEKMVRDFLSAHAEPGNG